MTNVVLRPAESADAPAIASVHVQSWRDAYATILDPEFLSGPIEGERLGHWTSVFARTKQDQIVLVAQDRDRRLIGFVCAVPDADVRFGSLVDNLHVLPCMRGERIGEQLLRAVARQLIAQASSRKLHLWVFEANHRAVRFYERLGGEVVGRDLSTIPAAHGEPIVCIHWPQLEELAESAAP